MGENLKEHNIDEVSNFVPKIISAILTEVSLIDDFPQKLSKLDFHVKALEEELEKIEFFKSELPNCMHLLKDAIEKLKEEELQLKGKEVRPVMKQFIPLKSDFDENGREERSGDFSDKKNWMSSAQLWSTPVLYENNFASKNQGSGLHLKSRYQEVGTGSEYQQQMCDFGSRREAFVPFKEQSGGDVSEMGSYLSLKGEYGSGRVQQQQQAPRKQRHHWSLELHQRFTNALHQLGGAQAATPKQIRELIKVDGLTNDEVKSRLQKYRLQIQKLSSSSAGVSSSSLNHRGSTKGVSINGGDSMEEDDDKKSESHC